MSDGEEYLAGYPASVADGGRSCAQLYAWPMSSGVYKRLGLWAASFVCSLKTLNQSGVRRILGWRNARGSPLSQNSTFYYAKFSRMVSFFLDATCSEAKSEAQETELTSLSFVYLRRS